MTIFVSRSGWNALPANRESSERTETSIVFVHHSATPKPRDIAQAREQVLAIQRDHLTRTVTLNDGTVIPWADIAYNILVGPGVILEGRGWDVRGGGTGPGNKIRHASGSWDNVSVSICVLGNYQVDVLDALTREALVAALAEARNRYGPNLAIMGDRDVNTTACCGDNLYPLLNELWVQSSSKENDEMTAEQFAAMLGDKARANGGVVEVQLNDGNWYPFSHALQYIHTESQRKGTMNGLSYENIVDAVRTVIKERAAVVANT